MNIHASKPRVAVGTGDEVGEGVASAGSEVAVGVAGTGVKVAWSVVGAMVHAGMGGETTGVQAVNPIKRRIQKTVKTLMCVPYGQVG